MSWSYDPTGLTDSDLMKVRFLIQDTNSSRPLYQDEEIEWTISQAANIYTAAAELAEQLVTKAGAVKAKKVGDLFISYNPSLYVTISAQMRARGAGHQVPYAGGISVGDKRSQESDSDATKPSVFRGLDENPGAPKVVPPGTDSNPLTSI